MDTVTNSWILELVPESKDRGLEWLKDEGVSGYCLIPTQEAVQVGFNHIDDAFRFRLQFDEELLA